MKKKLMLIDGNGILFKAYHATAHINNFMRTSTGFPTNAVFLFASMLNKLMLETDFDHILVAWDTGKPTFRHEKYNEYKGTRSAVDEALILQFPVAREFLKSAGINSVELDGYEADDIIGTIAKQASDQNYEVNIYCGDKDLLQLIDDNITVHLSKKGLSEFSVMTVSALKEQLGIVPSQIIDLKALMGDASDNIPGIPGIGEKTALKLLNEYSTVENVLASASNIKGKLKEKIIENDHLAILSKELATICLDVPLRINEVLTIYQGFNASVLKDFYQKYEMKSLLNKLTTENNHLHTDQLIDYTAVTTIPKELLSQKSSILLLVEGENYFNNHIIGLAICFNSGDNFYISVSDMLADNNLRIYLADESIAKITYDVKQHLVCFERLGLELKGCTFDLLLAGYVINPDLTSSFSRVLSYFSFIVSDTTKKDSSETIINNLTSKCSLLLKVEVLALAEMEKLQVLSLYREIEWPLAFILTKMERVGIQVDRSFLERLEIEYKEKMNIIENKIFAAVGSSFNLNSPKQLAVVLFDDLQLPPNKKRSTASEELLRLLPYHPIIEEILLYRKYAKLCSTYVVPLREFIADDGRIHTNYNQALTKTGRISSSNPNLQNIATKDEESKAIKKAFVAKVGYSLISIDYSQIELRVLAVIANEKSMIEAFSTDKDIHVATAMNIYDCSETEVDAKRRREAKTVNFGIIYGQGDFGLSEQLGITIGEARDFIKRYFAKYNMINDFINTIINQTKELGYVTTFFNRRRLVPELNEKNINIVNFGKRIAVNTRIQGTAADIIKIAMINIDKAIAESGCDINLLLQIHDELVFEVKNEEIELALPLLEKIMVEAVDWSVPLKVESGQGANLYDCK